MPKHFLFIFQHLRNLTLLGLVAVLSGLAFLWFMRDAASQTAPVQIATVNTIAVAEESGDFFILNQDQTVSIYDVEGKSFRVLQGPLAYRAENIVASPSGKYFATFSFGENAIFTALYTSEAFIVAGGRNPDMGSYTLPRVGRGSAAVGRFSLDERNFYVADSLGKKIYSINLDTKKFSEINTPSPVADVQTNPSGELLFILTQNTDEVLILDAESRVILQRYQIGAMPGQMLYNQTLNRLYVSSRGEDAVSVVDLAKKEARQVKVGPLPRQLTYNKASGEVFVANNGDGSIHVISPNLALTKIDLKLPAYASYPISLWYSNAANKLIALNSAGRRLYFIDSQELRIIKEENVQGWARYVAGGQAAPLAVVHRSNSSDLLIVDPAKIEATYLLYTDAETRIFSSPQGVAVDPETGRVFVGNLGAGEIVILDGKQLRLVGRVPVGVSPYVLYFDKGLKKLYISDPVDNSVTIVDTSQNNFPTKIIPIEGMPRTILGNGKTGIVYTTLAQTRRVGVIDGARDAIVTEIPLPADSILPLLIAVNEGKNEIYVADYGADFVSVIDGTTNTVTKTIKVGQKPIWISYYPEIDKIYVAVEGDKKAVVINPKTYEVIKEFAINASPYRIFLDRKTSFVYVTHRAEKKVTIFENDGDRVELLAEKEMPFLGQLDAMPYNMIFADTRFFTEKTDRVFITSQVLNNLSVLRLERDAEGIMNFHLIATINSAGEVFNFETGAKESVEEAPSFRLSGWAVVSIILLIALFVAAGIYWKRKASALPPDSS